MRQRIAGLAIRYKEMRFWLDREWVDLDDWLCDGTPLALGAPWPDLEGVKDFVLPRLTLDTRWPLAECRLQLNLGGEGLVRILYDGGDEEDFGLDPHHQRFPLRAHTFEVRAEVVARFPFGEPNRGARLERARAVWHDPHVERLERLVRMVWEAARVLGEHEAVEPMVAAAERALATVRWPSGTIPYLSRRVEVSSMQKIWELPPGLETYPPPLNEEERASAIAAADRLEADLCILAARYPRDGSINLTGHAHIDLAWLWPMAETRRKARRTFSTIAGLIDRYEEFRFNQSSAQLYAFVEEDDPDLFARIKERVATGQWEPVGGMWVEPDINMPAGESLARQLLYGQRYFERTFGSFHTVCWLPDCFGFAPGLPQLLQLAGIENFFTIKLTWSETNRFPYDLFWWEGLDGSKVLGHMFTNPGHTETDTGGYNGDSGPHALANTWRNFRGKAQFDSTLLSIGYGDGGGGVTPEMIEQARTLRAFPALPEAHFGSVRGFFDRMREAVVGKEIPTWLGEMYLELHRGTLTTQGRTKYLHRRAERSLVAAEAVAAVNYLTGGPEPGSLEKQWHLVLRNEFHDILPGSSIGEVYQVAEAELTQVVEETGAVARDALRDLAGRLTPRGDGSALFVFNPDAGDRPLRLETAEEFPGAQAVEDGYVLCSDETVPALGARLIYGARLGSELAVSTGHLENRYVRVTVDQNGNVLSLYDKPANREALAAPGTSIWAYVDKPTQWEAWDIDANYFQQGEPLRADSIEIVEEGPYRAAIRVVRRFRNSTVTQEIRLWANSARLEFKTTLDWHDRRWLLKARFPLNVRSSTAAFETAFGVVERPTHRNTSWEAARFEVAGHRFADLSEPGYGVALLNDGKYGHHALGNELGLSLLRSPTYPDPLADEGVQTFTYALYPHTDSWLDGGVLTEAEDLNSPLLVQPVSASHGDGQETWQPIRLDGIRLGLGTLKVLEAGGGLVLRAYEPQGARGAVELRVPDGWQAESTVDLLERPIDEPNFNFTPFAVRSWLLRSALAPTR